MDKTMITSLAWIKKGFAKSMPKEFDIDDKEIEEIKQDPYIMEELNKQANEMNMEEDYDEESNLPVFSGDFEKYKQKNAQKDDGYPMDFEDMSEEEKEDYAITPNDALIVASKIEDEFSTLEVYVYEELKCNLYSHHEITLSAFPLCLEWLPVEFSSYSESSAERGNYVIVGTFLPEIEIWNLDVVNSIEPVLILGGENEPTKKKSVKSKKKKSLKEDSHEDAVISLSLNKFRKNLLASGSADQTVKIWDLTQRKCAHTFKNHSDKVQVLKWNPTEESLLFSAGFDHKLVIQDVRQANSIISRSLDADIESGLWDPLNPTNIVISNDNGYISQIDVRKLSSNFVFNVKAHEKAATSVSMSYFINGLLATSSLDGSIKVWDTHEINGQEPKLVATKKTKAGKLYCSAFYEDNPWLLACGSSLGDLVIWDTIENDAIKSTFESRLPKEMKKIEEEQ